MSRLSSQFAIVASGDVLSSVFDVRNNSLLGMTVPVSLTSETFVKMGATVASADQHRLQKDDGSGDWSVVSGASASAPRAVALTKIAGPFPFGRIELGAAATDTRTFTVIGKAQ